MSVFFYKICSKNQNFYEISILSKIRNIQSFSLFSKFVMFLKKKYFKFFFK